MAQPELPSAQFPTPWIVCHRRFEMGHAGIAAFSTEQRAYRHAARLIRDELETLFELDADNGRELLRALREGLYETAVRLYHEIEGNPDAIDVTQANVDQFHSDEPLEFPAPV